MKPRSATLSSAFRGRLAKLLGMTGSDHDGEVLNAARMADRIVREQGTTWSDVLGTPTPVAEESPQHPWQDVLRDWPVRWQAAATLCMAYGHDIIRPKDIVFASKIAEYTHRPSDAQLVWLRDITQRVLTGGVT